MDEFVGRMATQRHVLEIINTRLETGEKLYGLSSKAIDRWAADHQLAPQAKILQMLKHVSGELFFMATRSQEPVSEEYELRRKNILDAVSAIERYLQ